MPPAPASDEPAARLPRWMRLFFTVEVAMSVAIGFPWFDRGDYEELRRMFSDGERLPSAFDEWLLAATEALSLFRAQRLAVVQVRIEPRAFRAWCRERNLRADYKARHQFTAEIARGGADMDGGDALAVG